MSTNKMTIVPRVNFYDGQKVSEVDLDQEQLHNRILSSGHTSLSHGSGIVRNFPLEKRYLLDLSNPGLYGNNTSKFTINSGTFDGKSIFIDRQPSDVEFGNRLILELTGGSPLLSSPTKVLIFGVIYNPLDSRGQLVTEYVEFLNESSKITTNSFKKIYSIVLNNFSGGSGSSFYGNGLSINYKDENPNFNLKIYESDSIKVFSNTLSTSATEYPNYYLNNFITHSSETSIEEVLEESLDSTFDISELYYQKDTDYFLFSEGDNSTTSCGQKFLAKTKTLQKISVLASIDTDISNTFSGSIVLSIHKLTTSSNTYNDVIPDNLINFDPEISPIAEVSYSYEDFESMGIYLNGLPQIINFDLSSTLLGNPNLEPTLEIDSYYCFIIRRVGDTSIGTFRVHSGYEKTYQKNINGQALTIQEQFDPKTTTFFEFDKINNKYIDNFEKTLWFELHSSLVEISSGSAIAEDGIPFNIPSFVEYIGNNLIPFRLNNIEIPILNGNKNYIILDRAEKFSNAIAHPRTGNYTFTRILDSYEITILNQDTLDSIIDLNPNILASIEDKNSRSPSDIEGSFEYVGQVQPDKIYLINPTSDLLDQSIVGRLITPDTGCECNSKYKIESIKCSILKNGDLNGDNKYTNSDLLSLINLAGSNFASPSTQMEVLKGNISFVDLYKSDLDNNGIIDGSDIEKLENAINGVVSFDKPEKFTLLEIKLSNINPENNYPIIFEDTLSSGSTSSGTNNLSMTVNSTSKVIIRVGDTISIPESSADAGSYKISSIEYNDLVVTFSVLNLDNTEPEFTGESSLNFIIISGTKVNLYVDNNGLISVPFSAKDWNITSSSNLYRSELLINYDLRRFVEQSILSINEEGCLCVEDSCSNLDENPSVIINDKIIPNNLFIPNGDILSSPGVPHHGDFEFSTIEIPIPSGDISGCSINIYDSFIKSHNGGCNTISGYPAMRFSDGTLVGCNDTESVSDLSLGRVKLSKSLTSLYIDNYIDGYIGGEEVEASKTSNSNTIILSSSIKEDYPLGFSSTWSDVSSSSESTVNYTSEYASLELDASTTSVTTSTIIGRPISSSDISGDFTILFTGNRNSWDDTKIALGTVKSYAKMVIQNSYGGESTINFGWRQTGSDSSSKLFYSGSITDGTSEIYNFDFEIDCPDAEGDDLEFKIERSGEILNLFYYHKNTSLLSDKQKYIRIGENLDYLIGNGDSTFEFVIESISVGVHSSYLYKVRFFSNNFVINYDQLLSDSTSSSQLIVGASDGKLNEITFNFPVELKSGTEIISAEIIMTAADSFNITSEDFVAIPYYGFNSKNIFKYIDIIRDNNSSIFSYLNPASGVAGDQISIDITNFISNSIQNESHISGYYKSILITSLGSESESFTITNEIIVNITYYDLISNAIIKVGSTLDPNTGILTIHSKNVLYDSINESNRTKISVGVFLKKSGFKNNDMKVDVNDLSRLWIGVCSS